MVVVVVAVAVVVVSMCCCCRDDDAASGCLREPAAACVFSRSKLTPRCPLSTSLLPSCPLSPSLRLSRLQRRCLDVGIPLSPLSFPLGAGLRQ